MRNIRYRSALMTKGPAFLEPSLQIHSTDGYVSLKNVLTEEQIAILEMGFSFPIHYLKTTGSPYNRAPT
jgi:hypothetical protein